METILVTGAMGQVGRRCAEILLDRGRTVIATDLHNDNTAALAEELAQRQARGRLIVSYVDLTDADAVRDLVTIHRPQAIAHLAGVLAPTSYRNPRVARKVNVGGTTHLVEAAKALPEPPLIILASSAAVYGSRNPYHYPELITPDTPINPMDHYGEDKMLAESVLRDSGLPHALLRLAGVVSPDGASSINADHLLLMRAIPSDNPLHSVHAHDVALAFANAIDRMDAINGKVLLIAGDDSHKHTNSRLQDDMMRAVGIGPLGPSAGLPGNPDDDRGWGPTGYFDTTEAQALLDFQKHNWDQTVTWIADSQAQLRPTLRLLSPVLRPAIRAALAAQRRIEKRGPFADPWTFMSSKYGPDMLAQSNF